MGTVHALQRDTLADAGPWVQAQVANGHAQTVVALIVNHEGTWSYGCFGPRDGMTFAWLSVLLAKWAVDGEGAKT